jgi:hypothetical protein
MGDQQPGRQGCFSRWRQLLHDGFARQAVEAVATQALHAQGWGQWQRAGPRGHVGVELRVEASDLVQPRVQRLRAANHRQHGRRMQRRERLCCLQPLQDCGVDAAMLAQHRPAVHHAVPHGLWRRGADVIQQPCKARHRIGNRGQGCGFAAHDAAAGIDCLESAAALSDVPGLSADHLGHT